MEDVMRIRRTVAAGLAGILLIQSAALAQTAPAQEIRTISHERGVAILLANLEIGTELRIDLANGDRVEGRLVEKSDQQLIVITGGQRRIVSTADVFDVRVPMPAGITGSQAFGIGTAIGAGVVLGWFAYWRLKQ
jgi:hypothetical protein